MLYKDLGFANVFAPFFGESIHSLCICVCEEFPLH